MIWDSSNIPLANTKQFTNYKLYLWRNCQKKIWKNKEEPSKCSHLLDVCKMLRYFSQHIPRAIPTHHPPFPKQEFYVLDFNSWLIQHSADTPKKCGQVLTEMARLTQKRQGLLHVHCCQFMGEPAGSAHILARSRFPCMGDARPVSNIQTPSLLFHPSTPPDWGSAQQEASSSWQKHWCMAMLLFTALC